MTLGKGLGDDLTLLEQNEAFGDSSWFYDYIDDDDRYYSRQLTYCEALLSGTTFIVENMYWGLGTRSVQAMNQVGIRGALAEDIRKDFSNPDIMHSPKDISEFAKHCKENNILPIIGSISEEDFHRERLQKISEITKSHSLITTFHLAETTWRLQLIKEKFNTSPIKFLYENGVLGEKVLGSHVVHLDSEEIKLLASTGTKVVNTPLCEMKICDGIAPIPEMVKAGVCVCLGTDGAMWNNSNDIFREMKGMSLLHTINSGIRSLDKKEILDMATLNGAKAFGLEELYGSIEKGKKADFILIETNSPHMQPLVLGDHENVTSAVVYSATGSDVAHVFVNGRQVVENHKLLDIDLDFISKKVYEASIKVHSRL